MAIEALERPSSDDFERAAAEFGVTRRQFDRYRKKFGVTRDLMSLARGQSGGGRGSTRLAPEVEALIAEVRLEFDRDRPNSKNHHITKEIRRRCRQAGLDQPSFPTLRSRLHQVPLRERRRARYGSKFARERHEPLKGKTPETSYPLDRIQIDHTLVDMVCTGDQEREHLGRCWITIALDECSRSVLAFVLSWEYPNATTIALLMARILTPKEEWLKSIGSPVTWPMWGKPGSIYVDNAPELSSKSVLFGCRAQGIQPPETRPGGQPHFGGIIERFMGNAMDKMRLLRGSTVDQRGFGKEKTRDPNESAEMSRSELELWLLEQICEQYHHTPHSGIGGQAPIKAWERGIFGTEKKAGRGLPEVPPDKNKVFLDFAAMEYRTIQRYGIRWDGDYWDEILRPFLDSGTKRKFLVKRNPYDLSCIWLLNPDDGQYYEIPSKEVGRPRVALWELKESKRLVRQRRDPVDEERMDASVSRQREIEAKAKSKTTRHKRRMNKQRRADAELLGVELGLTPPEPSSSAPPTTKPTATKAQPQRRGGTFKVVVRE